MGNDINETLYSVWLLIAFGAANPRIHEILSVYGDAYTAYQYINDGRLFITQKEKALIKSTDLSRAKSVIEYCNTNNINIILYDDDEYPSRLRTIFNPPLVLFARGDTTVLNNELSITVVGTRKPTVYGEKVTSRISSELAGAGFTIVSGFAAGIDSAAHRAAIKAGGKTIAVLGCGINIDYPKANSDIRAAVEENGVFITEFIPDTPPTGKNFPMRNRILSGISPGVLITEAPLGSGALITADLALEQGRDVFCVPPADIFDKSYLGVVRYLRDGAISVFSHLDIVYEYYTVFSHKLSSLTPANEYSSSVSESSVFSDSKENVLKEVMKDRNLKVISYENLDDEQIKIVKYLDENGKKHIDEISAVTGVDINELLVIITELEMSGVIVSYPGKIYGL